MSKSLLELATELTVASIQQSGQASSDKINEIYNAVLENLEAQQNRMLAERNSNAKTGRPNRPRP
ncbi:hypothetical protein [Bacillus sp. REN10]|uniref:hypothetical protein n=1 Tax=Bacillus sp. REN10 TaxID=2782541 RepID=UPI00193BAF63|nr:hypothetical protein [Bacillus sp. REN10]